MPSQLERTQDIQREISPEQEQEQLTLSLRENELRQNLQRSPPQHSHRPSDLPPPCSYRRYVAEQTP